MTHQIKMPDAGQTTDAATIAYWHVKVGDSVKRGDVLLEVETDKTTLDIESFATGVVTELRFNVGDEVRAGDVLVVIENEAKQAAAAATPAPTPVVAETPAVRNEEKSPSPVQDKPAVQPAVQASAAKPAVQPVAQPVTQSPAPEAAKAAQTPSAMVSSGTPAMPNAKKLARELEIDVQTITPANGQFVKRSDVEALRQQMGAVEVAAQDGVEGTQEYTVLPMSNMRVRIGARMLESVQQIPSFTATIRVDMTACIALRKRYQEVFGNKVSYNDLMAKALAVAATKYSLLNARYENNEVRVYRHTNVGIAVGVEGGLLVPVVRKVDTLGLSEIAAANQANIESARAGKLSPANMGGGSVSISNLGMYDIDEFTAIINPPESCIFALGKIDETPRWTGETWKPVPLMSITGTFDHRIMDGAYGAQILSLLKTLLEQPELMLV